MASNPFIRKQFLVNKPYQFRLIAEILLVVILASTLSAGAVYVLMTSELDSGFHSTEEKLLNVRQALPRVLALSTFVTIFAMALLGGFITLRETHRLMGPVGKMDRKFKEMTEGDFSYMIPFRKTDVLKGLDESINIHLNNLSDFFTTFDKVQREVVPMLGALERSDGDPLENLQSIRTLLAELDHYAEAFRPA